MCAKVSAVFQDDSDFNDVDRDVDYTLVTHGPEHNANKLKIVSPVSDVIRSICGG